jgi:DNA-directed RNA polymerase specialized sigma24 family protein
MAQRKDIRGTLEALTPGLRRYARALSAGETPSVADDLVLEALETLREGPNADREPPSGSRELRLRLYAAFTRVAQRKLRAAASAGPSLRHPVIVHGLADLRFEDREALLLVVLEGFSYIDAAKLLGVDCDILASRLMRARARLAAFDNQPSAPSDGTRRALHLRVIK